jgi:hypothetical protein
MEESYQHQTQPNSSGMSYLLFVIVIVIAWNLLSCGENSTGVNGVNGVNGATEIGTEPIFTNVGQIFQAHCAPCHISETTNGVRLNTYNNVINSVGSQYGEKVVNPGDADGSPLIDKLGPSPQFGGRMPEGASPLTNARIDQIKAWIDAGAENN